jgi:hypothetical protein
MTWSASVGQWDGIGLEPSNPVSNTTSDLPNATI